MAFFRVVMARPGMATYLAISLRTNLARQKSCTSKKYRNGNHKAHDKIVSGLR